MTNQRYVIAEKLNIPIVIVGEAGELRWTNSAFEETFGDDAAHGLKEAALAAAG